MYEPNTEIRFSLVCFAHLILGNSLGFVFLIYLLPILCCFTGAGGSDQRRGFKRIIKRTRREAETSSSEEEERQDDPIIDSEDEAGDFMSGDEDVELEQDRRERLTNLTTVLNLGLKDYRRMRKYISYDPLRTSSSAEFYKNEQQLIFKEVYQRFAHAVCPQKPLNFSVLEDKDHTRVAAQICNYLGLSNLIERKCNYNIKLVQQFFATLVIGKRENIPLTWMTGDRSYKSDFSKFANLLGYDFISAEEPCGAMMHTPGVAPLKAEMTPLYLSDAFTPGKTYGLNRLFNTLLRIFRNNIALIRCKRIYNF